MVATINCYFASFELSPETGTYSQYLYCLYDLDGTNISVLTEIKQPIISDIADFDTKNLWLIPTLIQTLLFWVLSYVNTHQLHAFI